MDQFTAHKKPQKKLRVLCLHGYMTNAKLMEYQLKQWRQVYFKNDIEFVCMNGLYKLPPKANVDPKLAEAINQTENQLYSWFSPYASEQKETFEYVVKLIKENGPFDGILGFSQGGYCIFSLLLRVFSQKIELASQLKFAIMICTGFNELPHSHANFSESIQLPIPSVHLIGDNDFLYQHSMILSTFFKSPEIIFHNSGHKIPRLDREDIMRVKKFIGQAMKLHQIKEKQKNQKKETDKSQSHIQPAL